MDRVYETGLDLRIRQRHAEIAQKDADHLEVMGRLREQLEDLLIERQLRHERLLAAINKSA